MNDNKHIKINESYETETLNINELCVKMKPNRLEMIPVKKSP